MNYYTYIFLHIYLKILHIYLSRVMKPLPINKELILMLTLRQVQDCHKVIVACVKKENRYYTSVNILLT